MTFRMLRDRRLIGLFVGLAALLAAAMASGISRGDRVRSRTRVAGPEP